ncbi:MAG TPA: TlpA disulfide reductase family protein [Pyrinomonadaceae bacterium]|jgi:thiol-disulfide isomerase/thioredoxin|nr:TlpA disulfide reductase family protein [Pyrinomonadaceae bacterium]
MRPRLKAGFNSRRIAAALAVAALVALAASCDMDGASKKNAMAKAETPSGPKPPRTNVPMPPVSASHGGGEATPASAAPSGAWRQTDGRRATLEDLRGQVVVLDFWATYCPPCREEIPHLVRLQKEFGPQGLKVIGLNVGGEEDRPKVPEFVKLYKIQYQLADPEDETVRRFLLSDDIPQTFVIDRQGRVVEHVVGFDGEVAGRLERAVSQALSTKAD